jgi:predicted murein hydrolase (TIGR00659 family)
MNDIINNPLFGVLISLTAFEIGSFIYKKTKLAIFNPLLISMILIAVLLTSLHISYESFNKGGQIISFFLGPSTVILALPLYKKINLLKNNALAIILGILNGSIVAMMSVVLMSKFFGISDELTASLIPKSITTPIGIEVAKQLGGIPSVTVVIIIITGIIGSIIVPPLLKLFKIKDKIAFGIALGTSSHAIGTAKALEIGESEGAMSGLSIGIAGIITVILAPVVWTVFQILFK